MDTTLTAVRWDEEYRQGRYIDESPVPFVTTIATTLENFNLTQNAIGLYVGCGNGRNHIPLVDMGLNLYGLDVSQEAIAYLTAQRPQQSPKLCCKDFLGFQSDYLFDYLIAIQVFQHGREATISDYFLKVATLLKPGGLFFLRVNGVATEIYHEHTTVEKNDWGGFTIEYLDGAKRGLPIHFFSRKELSARTEEEFAIVVEPREDVIRRSPPKTGSWVQWEGIWQRR